MEVPDWERWLVGGHGSATLSPACRAAGSVAHVLVGAAGHAERVPPGLPEGIGDACQCGDTTGDGYIATSEDEDLAGLLSHLVSPDESIEGRCSVDDEGSCTIRDVVIHKRALGEASLPSEFESDQCEAFTGS